MGKLIGRLVLAACGISLLVSAGAARADDPPFVTLGVGYFDFNEREAEAVDFRVEYRHNERLWLFKPWAGIEITSDKGFYGAVGVLADFFFGRRIVVTPSFGVGAYRKGDGKDLGGTLEFRSQVEVAYRFNDRSRLGVAVGHISNAGIASDDNPGVEIVTVYYSIPLQKIFR